jgi:hypothetical protein
MNILQCGSDSENSKCFGLKMRIIRQRTALTHSTRTIFDIIYIFESQLKQGGAILCHV